MAAPEPRASACWDELSDLALMLRSGLGALLRDDARKCRREGGKDDEREEPRDVEIEPVGKDELEADQERGGESAQLDDVLRPRDEVDGDGRNEEDHLQTRLDVVEVGHSRVLVPVPDRERRGATQLPPEGAVPEDPRGMERMGLEQEDPEGERGSEEDAAEIRQLLAAESAPVRIGRPERDEEQRRELRPPRERDEHSSGRR